VQSEILFLLIKLLSYFNNHCEKSLFVLASRQKIPALWTEIPAVDTRTICLLPIQFFKITHARKATAGKYRPETADMAGKSRPSGARKGKAGKSRQVTTDMAGKFGCQ
jgi:hypothetical protein